MTLLWSSLREYLRIQNSTLASHCCSQYYYRSLFHHRLANSSTTYYVGSPATTLLSDRYCAQHLMNSQARCHRPLAWVFHLSQRWKRCRLWVAYSSALETDLGLARDSWWIDHRLKASQILAKKDWLVRLWLVLGWGSSEHRSCWSGLEEGALLCIDLVEGWCQVFHAHWLELCSKLSHAEPSFWAHTKCDSSNRSPRALCSALLKQLDSIQQLLGSERSYRSCGSKGFRKVRLSTSCEHTVRHQVAVLLSRSSSLH